MSTLSKPGPREYIGYVRVSKVHNRDSEENKDRFHSPDMQLDRIKASIEAVDGTYVDFKYDPDRSGYTNIVREGWNEAVAWVMENPTQRGIVAYDTSRLSRNLWRLLGDIQHTLVPAGARVLVSGESIDTAQHNWQLQLQMTGMIAEQFSLKVGDRWRDVHEDRRKNKQSPVGKVPYGYRKLPTRLDPDTGDELSSLGIEPDPETAPIMRRIYALYLDGQGLRAICEILNKEEVDSPKKAMWSTVTISRLLNNGAAAGLLRFKGELSEGGWDALIDQDTWESYLRMAEKRRKVPNRSQSSRWTLAGIARCAKCGATLAVNYLPPTFEDDDSDEVRAEKISKNRKSSAMCATYRTKGKTACEGVFFSRMALENQFTMFLGSMLEEVGSATVGKASESREAQRLDSRRKADEARADLQRASEQRVRLALLGTDGTLNEAERREAMRHVNRDADQARDRLEVAENAITAAEPLADVWEQLKEGGEGMSPQAWNLVLKRVMQRVEVSDETVLFVPTLGEPVEWKRQTVSREAQRKQADAARDGAEIVAVSE